jgi:hypothetical protein
MLEGCTLYGKFKLAMQSGGLALCVLCLWDISAVQAQMGEAALADEPLVIEVRPSATADILYSMTSQMRLMARPIVSAPRTATWRYYYMG